jgi:hypothetical protein
MAMPPSAMTVDLAPRGGCGSPACIAVVLNFIDGGEEYLR